MLFKYIILMCYLIFIDHRYLIKKAADGGCDAAALRLDSGKFAKTKAIAIELRKFKFY